VVLTSLHEKLSGNPTCVFRDSPKNLLKKGQALTLCFSHETLSIVQNLGLSNMDKQDITAIITAIKKYINGHINESVECRNFCRRTQQPGESFDNFLLALCELVKTCNFCSNGCTQKNIRGQIIKGILDGDTVKALLQVKDLTLDKAIQICQAQETAKKQRGNMTSVHQESVAAIHNLQPPRKKPLSFTTPSHSAACPGCSIKPHPGGQTRCPAFGLPCNTCGKLGHFAKVCHSRSLPSEPKSTPATSTNALSAYKDPLLSNIHSFQTSAMLLLPTPPLKLLSTLPHKMAQYPSLSYQTQVLTSPQLVNQYFTT